MKTDHLKLLCDIQEISNLFSGSADLRSLTRNIVEMISRHMNASVASIYIFNEPEDQLILYANVGLNPEMYPEIRLSSREGLVGKAIRELRPICLKCASVDPEYKFFPGLNEEKFDAFLVVPVRQGLERIGAIVVQRSKKQPFMQQDIEAMTVIASQLASILLNVKQLSLLKKKATSRKKYDLKDLGFLKGKIASRGFAFSGIKIKERTDLEEMLSQERFLKKFEINDLDRAIDATRKNLENLQKNVEERFADGAALIFASHLLILKDKNFTGEMRELVKKGKNVPEAIIDIGRKYIKIFSASKNRVINEKQKDIEDLITRMLNNLVSNNEVKGKYSGSIVIARELFPSDILRMSSEDVEGLIVTRGGVTSHAAILARSLHIPMVVIDNNMLLSLPEGTKAIIDGAQGNVYIQPSEEVIKEFNKHKDAQDAILQNRDFLKKPSVTKDGTRIYILSNINLLSDLEYARKAYTDGIGLYRTEFPFLIRSDFPEEEEQYEIYSKLVKGMPGKPLTFRTLDLGGDKLFAYGDIREHNPFLGFRSIRFSLLHKDVFIKQIRAILRATAKADLNIMFPMISSLDEFIEAKTVFEECMASLEKEGRSYNSSPKIGIMVEVPSILDILPDIAKLVDFFSVGTNDLIQFVLAVDRTNDKVAKFYNPVHPSVLRSLKKIISTAQKYDIKASICGDMAHNEKYLPILLGMGFRDVSVDPSYIPSIKRSIAELDISDSIELANKLLKASRVSEVEKLLTKFYS